MLRKLMISLQIELIIQLDTAFECISYQQHHFGALRQLLALVIFLLLDATSRRVQEKRIRTGKEKVHDRRTTWKMDITDNINHSSAPMTAADPASDCYSATPRLRILFFSERKWSFSEHFHIADHHVARIPVLILSLLLSILWTFFQAKYFLDQMINAKEKFFRANNTHGHIFMR